MPTTKKTPRKTANPKGKSTAKNAATKKKKTAKKPATTKRKPAAKKAGDATVPVDRRRGSGRRAATDRRAKDVPVAVERRKLQRRAKVSRRRQIDPTTCERDYTDDEIEFMSALDHYKRDSGRMFPTCSEILEVVKKLGYERRPKMAPVDLATDESRPELASLPPSEPTSETTAV